MLSQLVKQPVFAIVAIVGCLLIFAGFFKIDDITKLAISPHSQPIYLSIFLGLIMVSSGLLFHIATSLSFNSFTISNLNKISDGYSITHGRLELNILFGKLQTFDCTGDDCLVALPANEFFDDECINDNRSVLGAYMQHHFKDNIPKIQALVKKDLHDKNSQQVEREPGIFAPSYGVGTYVYLDRPLSSHVHIVMVAVTTKRAGEGLRADAHTIFDSIAAIQQVMADHRLTRLYIPIIGSGHGGLKGQISLLCMLIAFAELHRHHSGQNLRSINVVVYRQDKQSEPLIPPKSVKRALGLANDLFES